jgi:hypothetical protein
MGSLAALINSSHGALPAAIAGGKQALYTFFFGGLIVQLCTRLASRPGPRAPVLAIAIAVPFLITVALITVVHSLRGTPEPLLTIGVVVMLGLPSFMILARRARAGSEQASATTGAQHPSGSQPRDSRLR